MREISSVTVIKNMDKGVSGTKHVKVNFNDNTVIDGFMKNSKTKFMDDIEIVASNIGKLLNVPTAEVFKYFNDGNECIISQSVLEDHDKEDLITIKDLIDVNNLEHNELIDRAKKIKPRIVQNEEDIKFIIQSGVDIIEQQEGITEHEVENYRKSYFDMLMFDYMTNQVDRSFDNFAIIKNKETNKIKFSPLFDNGCISKPQLEESACELNFRQCDRTKVIECLYKYFYDDIKDMSKKIIEVSENKDGVMDKIDTIAKENLDSNIYSWYMKNIKKNCCEMAKLEKEKGLNIESAFITHLKTLIKDEKDIKNNDSESCNKETEIKEVEGRC